MAKPTSAFLSAGPSLVPSPVTATTCRCSVCVLSMIPAGGRVHVLRTLGHLGAGAAPREGPRLGTASSWAPACHPSCRASSQLLICPQLPTCPQVPKLAGCLGPLGPGWMTALCALGLSPLQLPLCSLQATLSRFTSPLPVPLGCLCPLGAPRFAWGPTIYAPGTFCLGGPVMPEEAWPVPCANDCSSDVHPQQSLQQLTEWTDDTWPMSPSWDQWKREGERSCHCVCVWGGLQLCKLRCPRQDRDSSISLDRALSSSPCQTHHLGQRVLAPKPHQDPSIPLCPYPLHHQQFTPALTNPGLPSHQGPQGLSNI